MSNRFSPFIGLTNFVEGHMDQCIEVHMPNSVISLNWTHMFGWCLCGQERIKEQTPVEDTSLNEIRLHLQILSTTPHSIANTIGRTHVFTYGINNTTCTSDNPKNQGGVRFSI